MSITRLDFGPITSGGDNPTAAFVKLDANDADLDSRVTTAKTTADNAGTAAGAAQSAAGAAQTAAGNAQTSANNAISRLTGWGAVPTSVDAGTAASITGIYRDTSGSTVGKPKPYMGYIQLHESNTSNVQIGFDLLSSELYVRSQAGAAAGNFYQVPWARVWTDKNTTVDANNFIKKAS